MTLYEQLQRGRLTARIVEDIYSPPIDRTVMLVDLRPRVKRARGGIAVRVQKPTTPMMPEAVLRSTQSTRPSKDRGS
jgi:hypothetical protein